MSSVGATTRLPMSPQAFAELRALTHEHCGIWIPDDNLIQLERALTPRLAELDLGVYEEYIDHLKTRRAELDELAERAAVHETYFYREPDQLEGFRRLLARLAEADPGQLRVWSAGCSTGEEAYTIAMLIVDSGRYRGADVRVTGSDLSRRALAVARAGIYGRNAFRALPEELRRYFRDAPQTSPQMSPQASIDAPAGAKPARDQKLKVRDDVRALVQFGHSNLMDQDALSILGEVDVIFCRNVLMYFDPPARRRALDHLAHKLRLGGLLFVGHSESLLGEAGFERVPELSAAYRKWEPRE